MTKEDKQYYAEARDWESEMYASARKRARIWAWLAGLSLLMATVSVCALMMVMPLKEVVPYVIEVDRASGLVEVKRPLEEGGLSQNEAITKYFIVSYLTAREAYMYDRAQEDYVKVQKLSSTKVASDYHNEFNPANEDSPLNKHGKNGVVEIEIRNVSFIGESTVNIPIRLIAKKQGQQSETYEVVTLSFQYLNDPATEADRFINPLGFQVTAYRKDPQLIQE